MTRSAAVVPLGRLLGQPAVELLDPVDQRRGQQVVLAGEVAVDGAHGHVGPGRHVAHLHRLVAPVESQRHGRVDDPLAPCLLGSRQGTWHRTVRHGCLPYSPGNFLVTGASAPAGPRRRGDPSLPSRGSRPRYHGPPWSPPKMPEPIATTDGRVPGRRGRATRQRLLECTAELLAATPWRSIKVIDIARQAGTSPATFYQYFENVEAAITVLAEELVEGWGSWPVWSTGLVGGGQLGHGGGGGRGVHGVLGAEPGRVPGGRTDHRGGRPAVPGAPGAGAQRRHGDPGAGHCFQRRGLGLPGGDDPMAAAGTLIAMLAQVAAHRYGFEFWGIRTASLVDSQARLLHWSVTGRAVRPGAKVAGRRCRCPGPARWWAGAGLGPHRPGQGGLGRGIEGPQGRGQVGGEVQRHVEGRPVGSRFSGAVPGADHE